MPFLLSGCGGGTAGTGQVDPSLGDRPIVYVERTVPRDAGTGELLPRSLRDPAAFHGGARLMFRASAAPGAEEKNLTAGVFNGPYDVRDPSVSWDGTKLLFAMRAPEIPNADPKDQPTWNIWEYDVMSGDLHRVIGSDLTAGEGQDISPRFLPDGRIVFASTRQRQAGARLLDEGKPQFQPLEETRRHHALALHVMNDDGTDIHQISFNLSHDLTPVVDNTGHVGFTRWDNNAGRNGFNLYRTRPDGIAESIVYGAESHQRGNDDVQFELAAQLPDGRLLAWLRQPESLYWSGEPVAIDTADFVNRATPVAGVITGATAERPIAGFGLEQLRDDVVARTGRITAMAPLTDGSNRLLVAWSPCRLQQGNALFACTDANLGKAGVTEAPPAQGLWIFDLDNGTRLPVVVPQPGQMITDVAVVGPRPAPAQLQDEQPGIDLDQSLYDDGAGVLDIRSVYDVDGTFDPRVSLPGIDTLEAFRDPAQVQADQRPVAFLRVVRGVLIPDRDVKMIDNSAFGRNPAYGMREIVGYVPVEPDGSVRVEVPANVPLTLQLVDRRGRNLAPPHRSWISVRPGEVRQCNGCHEAASPAPHGRPGAEPPSINTGAVLTGDPFPNTRPELFANAGETMAEVRTRLNPDALLPSLEMRFTDIWTDPNVRTPDPDWSLLYADLNTPVPATTDCRNNWDPFCSIVIHYPDHIQPIWDLPRQVMDNGTMIDGTCSTCHSRRDAANNLQVPPAQLELTGDPSPDNQAQATSYRELLFPDNELTLQDGALIDRQVPQTDGQGNIVYQTDQDGNPVLDQNGAPIPVMTTVPVSPPMVAGRSVASRFFSVFQPGGAHEGWLTPVELRLLAEWLDEGGQYYNDPFAAP